MSHTVFLDVLPCILV